ncbi:Arginine transport system permease protein ArtQ [compost metagenome]|uniref:Amino acid ABC transporter membrane protein, PAAT family (TC 3.A.1.3.-) n=1 Tax=Clostridium intestinale DSM 6191 TaxID=1121320 RepID=A0A1M5ZBV4_9CLOT|nr:MULTISPECIES: amino acid ABC transporter permease [Clostridium]WRY50378.1 amino acid ABC transporter permease [Clostridium intestinale]SHI21694.1 amino acid ABC transporter membrane protein, PAAT family (TC 3.A.1.3.-) [Clostridium intestinale DSM 6191]
MDYVVSLLPSLTEGLVSTLKIFIVTLVLSIPLGIVIALGRLSKVKIISVITEGYIWLMRGTPLLLQIVFVFFGLPLIGISFDRFPAAIIAFVLNYAAYYGEIFRAGIQSIDKGQYEASEVLGMSNSQTFFRIIFPQMIKRVLPPVANEVITLVKDTALVYVVGLDELLKVAKTASNRDASLVPLVVVAVFYLLLTAVLTKVFQVLEKKYSYYQ